MHTLQSSINDDRFIHLRVGDALVVQHQLSGLRVRMTRMNRPDPHYEEGAEFYTVLSRPYGGTEIPSIRPSGAPGRDTPLDEHLGQGIGFRLYLHAASMLPENARFLSSETTQAASGLRRKLHQHDPHRWQYKECHLCSDRALRKGTLVKQLQNEWSALSEGEFRDHFDSEQGG